MKFEERFLVSTCCRSFSPLTLLDLDLGISVMKRWLLTLFLLFSLIALSHGNKHICIVGSGIGGASAAYFLREYSHIPLEISIYEEKDKVGGRMAVVELAGDTFEAGGSIIHPKNLHSVKFAQLLGLNQSSQNDDESFGIWNGTAFVFKTAKAGDNIFSRAITQMMNTFAIIWRYGTSLWHMKNYVAELLENFMELYEEDRPAFDTVEELLKSVDLYNCTQHNLEELLLARGLSQLLIDELVTFIMRINYGQNVSISGLAGGVSLCGSGGDLWAVKGGNWQLADGLIRYTNASLYMNHKVVSVTSIGGRYEVGIESGGVMACDAVVLATSLDESKMVFTPPINIPKRFMQHTYTTFVRGLLNVDYFGSSNDNIPELIGTMENSKVPFSSISVLKQYGESDKAYKVFSRAPMTDALLDMLFSNRTSTIGINWAAYPHYTPPERFAPYVLDEQHLYYINAFENAASTIETSAVSAENVARLLLSRISGALVRKADLKEVVKEKSVEDL